MPCEECLTGKNWTTTAADLFSKPRATLGVAMVSVASSARAHGWAPLALADLHPTPGIAAAFVAGRRRAPRPSELTHCLCLSMHVLPSSRVYL